MPTTCPPSRPSAPTWPRQAFPLLKRGIRINAICPGPTDTPLAQANKEMWLGFGADYRAEVGVEASTPLEQAYPLVFLCSDGGRRHQRHHPRHRRRLLRRPASTETFPAATPAVNFLLGRLS